LGLSYAQIDCGGDHRGRLSISVFSAHAVTLNVTGLPDIDRLNVIEGPGTDGGTGGAANAVTPPNTDTGSTATAVGGNGGNGGNSRTHFTRK
jgi:hypothetical protein